MSKKTRYYNNRARAAKPQVKGSKASTSPQFVKSGTSSKASKRFVPGPPASSEEQSVPPTPPEVDLNPIHEANDSSISLCSPAETRYNLSGFDIVMHSVFSSKTKMTISFCTGHHFVVHRTSLEALGEPEHLIFLLNKEEKKFAISTLLPDRTTLDANAIVDLKLRKKTRTGGYDFSNVKLCKEILKIMNWSETLKYTIIGDLVNDGTTIVYALEKAIPVTPKNYHQLKDPPLRLSEKTSAANVESRSAI